MREKALCDEHAKCQCREGGREGYVRVVRSRGGCYVPLRARRREGERKGGRGGYVQVVRNRSGCYVPLRARRREGGVCTGGKK